MSTVVPPGAFPGEHGLVAPGMSCYYTIRFSPDSLGDFDDILKIETQAKEPLFVRLEGRRPPPILNCTFHSHGGDVDLGSPFLSYDCLWLFTVRKCAQNKTNHGNNK